MIVKYSGDMALRDKESKDFLELLMCRDYIKLLKGDKVHLQEQLDTINKLNEELLAENNRLTKSDRAFKDEVRKETYVRNLLNVNKAIREKNRKLRKTNNDLVADVIRLQFQIEQLQQQINHLNNLNNE